MLDIPIGTKQHLLTLSWSSIANSSLQDCPAGSYCDEAEADSESETEADSESEVGPLHKITGTCPKGRYCPLNTERADQYKCPKGTFNDKTGQTNLTACIECTAG